jgi:predicted  nucleic acid-binding Zn-ribbon protein
MSIKNNLLILFCACAGLITANVNTSHIKLENKFFQTGPDKKKGEPNGKKNSVQKGDEKKDTASTDLTALNLKLDSVIRLMNAKVIPYIDAQNESENKVHEAEMFSLNEKIGQLNSDLVAKQKQITQQLEDKTKKENEIKELTEQLTKSSDQLLKQQEQLKLEIDALQKQSFKIDETILKSIGERLKITPKADPAWLKTYEEFKVKRDLLWQANECLSKPYDPKIKQLIVDLDAGFAKGQQFAELSKAKTEFLVLLKGYCEKTEEMKSLLNLVAKLNDLKDERDKRINNSMYFYVGYDYLISVILKNKSDFTYNPIKNTITSCE